MPHSEDEAAKILEPYLEGFSRVFPLAWDRWEKFGESAPDLRLQVCTRTRASMLSNFGANAAEEIFADMGPEIVLTKQPGFLLVIVESQLHVRLKKYRGRTCQTSGISTDQRKLFESQKPLCGFPEASNCVLGYILKPDASGISETSITCKTNKVLHWKIDVPLAEAGQVVEELPSRGQDVAEPGISSTLTDDERAEEGGIGG